MRGRDPFLASAAGLKPIIRGHRLLRQWTDGDEFCSWYDVDLETPVKSGPVTMSEWHTVNEGKLISGRVVFDTAAFGAALPPRDEFDENLFREWHERDARRPSRRIYGAHLHLRSYTSAELHHIALGDVKAQAERAAKLEAEAGAETEAGF